MYEQTIVFGPLTSKQLITLCVGIFLIYITNKYLDNYLLIITIALITIFTIFQRFPNKKIPIEDLEIYFKQKKSEMTQEDYNKMLDIRIYELEAYIEMRKQRNLSIDDNLYKILFMIQQYR